MKRFAAHYLYVPKKGFLKQQVIEVGEDGFVFNFFPLSEEIECVSWLPGVICLEENKELKLQAFHLYPFDFKEMKPAVDTRRRLLR
ncbi:hypothetical protein [Bacteroides sp. 224]|uniref:hypothetical protein n=1 Tax=Bacteroides sp. 224 TaxID=2302936 RepID=UPI0013D47D04|nr:hypothetical protein [Bacteroides sp. 224]NDV64346.1 hypothetical protein [Bacteroides sp. 224]